MSETTKLTEDKAATTQLLDKKPYPGWVEEMREIFRAGTVSQYVLYGSVFDLVAHHGEGGTKFYALKEFLSEVLFAKFDVVLYYSRGAGIKPLKGRDHFQKFLQILDEWTNTNLAGTRLPRDTVAAMEMLDGFLRYSQKRTVVEKNQAVQSPLRTAILLDFVQFLVPQSDASSMNERAVETMIRLMDWASDPAMIGAQLVTVLIAENLAGISRSLVENSYSAKIKIPLPNAVDSLEYLEHLKATEFPDLEKSCEVPIPSMADKVVGLTRVNMRHMVAMAVRNDRPITVKYLAKIKKELIEKECYGLLEFIESRTTLADVAGNHGAKTWLAQDAQLIREGRFSAVPMGYLMTGRIGTGKTWLTNCFAGEVGVPFVAFKNFRDKWMGASEGNLEKIFTVLRALGQVVVFVDEADQMAGKRSGGDDGGLSGRIYGMLAKEMSDTYNRGKIVWVFATSRPDLLEVDLKRPGRLDVHIPLFPPQDAEEHQALWLAMARKVGLTLLPEQVPTLPPGMEIGGNEIEALMVRAQRIFQLPGEGEPKPLKEVLQAVVDDYRPLAHKKQLEYMDLIAVKECTDETFLPAAYKMESDVLDARLEVLKRELRIN